jgi:hypothetical protein
MSEELLPADESARRLGISTASLYSWLEQSNAGQFMLRGQPVTIDYLQGGRRGQGRIKIEATEVQRLRELMRVRPNLAPSRRPAVPQRAYPGITVKLGRPDA